MMTIHDDGFVMLVAIQIISYLFAYNSLSCTSSNNSQNALHLYTAILTIPVTHDVSRNP